MRTAVRLLLTLGLLAGCSRHSAASPPSTIHPHATAPITGQAVAWTKDGRLVVLDAVTRVELRQLGTASLTEDGSAPGVNVSADGRIAAVWWADRDAECGERLAVVPVDGSHPLAPIGTGFDAAFSPDGKVLAWHQLTGPQCSAQAFMVRTLADPQKAQRLPIPATVAAPRHGVGPWWQANGARVVYQRPTLRPTYLAFDVSGGTSTSLDIACVDWFRTPLPDLPVGEFLAVALPTPVVSPGSC